MKLMQLAPDVLTLSAELSRSGSSKSFEERLYSSIDEIGLAEPLKVARQPGGSYLVVDGTMRLRAIRAIRDTDPDRFQTVSTYVLDYDRRYEIRYQSDIYQDLLPSQLAALVEHLHQTENVLKSDIARYIGVSPATLRNYTGLWRLLQRRNLFAKIVELMDVEVIPSSNPYAWLRLTAPGLVKVLIENFTDGAEPSAWIETMVIAARQGNGPRFPIKFVEATTDSLPPEFYRVGQDVRLIKRDLGQRKGAKQTTSKSTGKSEAAFRNLTQVSKRSSDPVLRSAAQSLQEYLQ